MTRILIVEDDESIRHALRRSLADRGHAVSVAATGMAGLEATLTEQPEVVLLDLGLPDVDGLTLIPMIRTAVQVPILVITAQDDDATVVRALDAGADDYVVKPFGSEQVEARIRAVLRRTAGDDAPDVHQAGGLRLDVGARTVSVDGAPVELSRKEFDMLAMLLRSKGQVVTRRQLLSEVWQQPYGGSDRTVDVHLSWLRRKLGESAAQPRYLHSVRGVGVRLVDPGDS